MDASPEAGTEAERLSAALAALYVAVLEPEKWTTALGALCAFVGGSSALLFHQDYMLRSGTFVRSFNTDPEWTRLYFEKYVAINPVLPFMAFMDAGTCTASSRIIDIEEFQKSQFHREWAAPQGYLDVVAAILEKGATVSGLFAVTMTETDGVAGDGEIARMELVAPHVRQAVRLSNSFAAIGQRVAGLEAALESANDAIVLLDRDARPVFANASARALAARDGRLRLAGRDGTLSDSVTALRIREAVRAGVMGEARTATADIPLPGQNGEPDWVASIMPVSIGFTGSSDMRNAASVVMIRRVQDLGRAPLEVLAQKYNFTPRELQVFLGVVQFGGVPNVARLYGLSPTTVRSHLQSVFDKTGVRRQADLARLAVPYLPPAAKPPAA